MELHIPFLQVFFFFETGSHDVALAGIELIMYTRMT